LQVGRDGSSIQIRKAQDNGGPRNIGNGHEMAFGLVLVVLVAVACLEGPASSRLGGM
jgi:hypothetical protein